LPSAEVGSDVDVAINVPPSSPFGPGTTLPIPVQKDPSHLQVVFPTENSCPTVGLLGKSIAAIRYSPIFLVLQAVLLFVDLF
jgi:hypothetical protein